LPSGISQDIPIQWLEWSEWTQTSDFTITYADSPSR
jgi:hypothetical protein